MNLARGLWHEWKRDNAWLLAGAVAFYAAFSMGPLLLIIIRLTRTFVDDDWARNQLFGLIGRYVNWGTAAAVERLITPEDPSHGTTITIVSATLLLFGASAVFRHLRVALDLILGAEVIEERNWLRVVRSRVFAVAMVIAALFIVLAAIAVTIVLSTVRGLVPTLSAADIAVWRVVDLIISSVVIAAVFAAILRFIPRKRLPWRNIGQGVTVAAILFTTGCYLLGRYVAESNVTIMYGSAASLFVVLVAVYFAVVMLFIAAELAKLLARSG